MADFVVKKQELIGNDQKVVIENQTDSSFDVGTGIIFHKSGLYEVSILGNKITISQAAERVENEWILCEDTKDIPDHAILACDRYGEELIGYLSYSDDQWLCESDSEILYDPVGWRELPKPLKVVKNG